MKMAMILNATVLGTALLMGYQNFDTHFPYNENQVLDEYVSDFFHEEINCLALNIYHEARGETILGQIAVAQVVMNRVDHSYWPDTVCDVVHQPHQFSWTNDHLSNDPSDEEAWGRALSVANTVYNQEEDDPTAGAVFYHANYISTPGFGRHHSTSVSAEIGVHVFYIWDGSWD